MTIGADHISLSLAVENDKLSSVRVQSQRTTMAARILEGKSPTEAAALLPLLFSLCGTAQLQAGIMAFEEALGYVPSPVHLASRALLLTSEGIGEHVTRILVDWADLAGLENDAPSVRELRRLLSTLKIHLFKDGQNDKIGGAELQIDADTLRSQVKVLTQKIQEIVFAQPIDDFLQLSSEAEFINWIETQNCLPARCLKSWKDEGAFEGSWPQGFALPSLDKESLNEQLDGNCADQFIAQPTLQGSSFETGPFVRQGNHDLIKAMVEVYGAGSLSRLTAKLIDLASLLKMAETHIEDLSQNSALFHTKALYKGLGHVEAVRGQLVHRIWLNENDNTITRYRILAPTEWNFHPNGVLKQALMGMDAQNPSKLIKIARVAIMALDPCVACDIVLKENGTA